MALSFRVRRGDSHVLPLVLTDIYNGGGFFDPAGHTLLTTFKADIEDPDAAAAIQKLSTVGGYTVQPTVATDGRVDLALVPADFSSIDPWVVYVFDTQAQNNLTGEVKTVCVGRLRVDADVTQSLTLSVPTTVVDPEAGYLSAAEMAAAVAAAAASAAAAAASALEAASYGGGSGSWTIMSEDADSITFDFGAGLVSEDGDSVTVTT